MSANDKKAKPNKSKSPNMSMVSLKDLADFADSVAQVSLSQNVKDIDDKVSKPLSNFNEVKIEAKGSEYVSKALSKLKAQRDGTKYINLRVRRDFRVLLAQIKLLPDFDGFNLGEILEAVFNAYLNEHKDLIGKQTVIKSTI